MGARAVRVDDRDIELSDPVNRSFQLPFKSRTSLPLLAASKVLATRNIQCATVTVNPWQRSPCFRRDISSISRSIDGGGLFLPII
jgi:hypothetical protein